MTSINLSPSGSPTTARDWLRAYPADVPASLSYPEGPLSDLLENAARLFPTRAGCSLFGRTQSYADLAGRSRSIARSLAQLGAGRGRRVGILLPNMPEYLLALQGTWLTGATALPLSPLMVAEEIERWLEMSGCHILITLDLLAPLAKGALGHGPLEHIIVTSLADRMPWIRSLAYQFLRVRRNGFWGLRKTPQLHYWEELLGASAEPMSPPVDPTEDSAVIVPTGGTTASPKAVMLTHRNLLCNAWQLRAWSRCPDGQEGMLGALPFFHVYGLTVGLLTGLAKAATIHLLPRFDAHTALELIEREHVELVPAVPAMLNAFNQKLRRKPRDLSFIRTVMSGASALTADVRGEFEKYGAKLIVEGYGLSEAGPVTHVNPLTIRNRPGTIGVPLPDTEARVVSTDTGEEVPLGDVGELVVRGPQVMKGYFDNPEETARTLRDGWLFTGDLVRRDDDGFFTVVDRKRDIIKTSGFLVYPAEVEEVLCRLESVAEAAVIGEPDHDKGEIVKALVVPRRGVRFSMSALESHCREHLSKQKLPAKIDIVSELPKNFLGKIQRRKLREAGATLNSPARAG